MEAHVAAPDVLELDSGESIREIVPAAEEQEEQQEEQQIKVRVHEASTHGAWGSIRNEERRAAEHTNPGRRLFSDVRDNTSVKLLRKRLHRTEGRTMTEKHADRRSHPHELHEYLRRS